MPESLTFEIEKKGFKKDQVIQFINDMNSRWSANYSAKDKELELAKKELAELRREIDAVRADKEKISNALIDAQRRADEIMEQARKEAEEEKKRLIHEADEKRDLIIERNKALRNLRIEAGKICDDLVETINKGLKEFSDDISDANEKYDIKENEQA